MLRPTLPLPTLRSLGSGTAALLAFALFAGCASDQPPLGTTKGTFSRSPSMDTGVRATVIRPGQSLPPMGATGHGPSSSYSSIGAASQIDNRNDEKNADDLPGNKAVNSVGGVLAWPFKKAWDVVAGDDEGEQAAATRQGAPSQAAARPPTRQEQQAAREREKLAAIERELEQRQRGVPPSAAPTPSPAPTPAVSAPPPRSGASPSIADELAQLQARWAPREEPGRQTAYHPAPTPARPRPEPQQTALADRVQDRDGDGRPDHWTYMRGSDLAREVFDDDGDGSADRTLHYESGSRDVAAIEEDTDRDGKVDAWAQYRDGRLLRRRADTRGDGFIDRWIYYEGGQLARQEEDTDGDGFRDRVAFYDAGRLVRREEDHNADGRPDVVIRYDAEERPLQREEDRNGDGRLDVRSIYRDGRLARREILDETAAGAGPEVGQTEIELPTVESLRFRE